MISVISTCAQATVAKHQTEMIATTHSSGNCAHRLIIAVPPDMREEALVNRPRTENRGIMPTAEDDCQHPALANDEEWGFLAISWASARVLRRFIF
jgi:hypothetical protein